MFTFFKSKIFQKQFLSFTLIIFTTFALLSTVIYTTTKKSLERQQFEMAEDYRIQASNSIKEWLNDKSLFVKSQALLMGKMGEDKLKSEEVFDIIKTQIQSNNNYLDFLILDQKGDIINSLDGPNADPMNLAQREYFMNGINGKSTITGFYKGAKTGIPVMAMGEPIYVDGSPQYVFAAIIGLEKVKQIVEAQNFGHWGHAYLVDKEGMFITDSRFISEFVKIIKNKDQYRLNSLAVNDLMDHKIGTNVYTDFQGERVLGSYEWLDSLQVGLIVEFKEKKVMQPINELMAVLSFLSVLVGVMGIILAFSISRRLMKPINILFSSIEKIMAGNYSEPVKVNTHTELDKLVFHFNTMQSVIKLREEQLCRKNEELRVQTAEAIEANQLKSQFLANMSHELRTPLNSIIGFTARVIKKAGDVLSEVQRENLHIVKEEAQHLYELINNLLDYSKIEAGKMEIHDEKINLIDIIHEVCSITIPLMDEKGLRYKQQLFDENEIFILSDRLKVKQILINLMSNATKYSEKGTITLSIQKEENLYRIDVQDEGIGIDQKNLKIIFDEFRQVDGTYTRKVGGTGLGLSITKKFTEVLGGKISVTSTLGSGSCFTVFLPVQRPDAALNDSTINNTIHNTGGLYDRKVLCIDDDPNVTQNEFIDTIVTTIDKKPGVDIIIADAEKNCR